MARPVISPIHHGQQGWDSTFNTSFEVLTLAPLPVVEYANAAALPAANLYDRCIAALADTSSLVISDGSNWVPVNGGGAPNGGSSKIVSTEIELDVSVALTWVGAFPAGVVAIGVTGRVTVVLFSVDGATHVEIGDGTDQNMHDNNLALTLGSTFAQADATADPTGWAAAARDVVITPIAGTLATGKVRLTAHYMTTTAPVT